MRDTSASAAQAGPLCLFAPARRSRAGQERQLSGARQWTALFSELYGQVEFSNPEGASPLGGIVDADLWQLRLCRIDVGAHRIALPARLARPGTHPFNHVRFQVAGTSFFEQDGRVIAIEPGDCVAYNLSRPHSIWSPGRTIHEAVIFPIELVKLQSVPVELLWVRRMPGQEIDDTGALAHAIVRSVLDLTSTLPQSAAAGVAQALLGLLNAQFSRDVAGPEGFSRAAMTRWRAKAYIDDHLREAGLGVAQVAAAMGCSTRYLHALFASEQASVSRRIWRLRLEKSREDLKSPASRGKSVTDIAFSWGFSSASHFTRTFRAHFGYPPSAVKAE